MYVPAHIIPIEPLTLHVRNDVCFINRISIPCNSTQIAIVYSKVYLDIARRGHGVGGRCSLQGPPGQRQPIMRESPVAKGGLYRVFGMWVW